MFNSNKLYKAILISIFIIISPAFILAGNTIKFDDYFIDKTMRIDFFHIGDAKEELITIDQIYQQGIWAGNPKNLIDPFNNGKYYIKIYDVASNSLIYSRGFNCIFGEYTTTDPAINGVKRSYHESALIPYPKKTIIFILEGRDKQNMLRPVFSKKIDPDAIQIIKEQPATDITVYKSAHHGNPHKKADIVLIAEGYTQKEYNKFKEDVDHYTELFFNTKPYKKYKKKFNIYGVFKASAESGVDEPRQGSFKNTAINSSFNALNLERYLLTEDNKSYQDIAAAAPCDAIIIMVNSERYGGGGIYNFYALTTVDHRLSDNVFLHEFGHSFAGLADEYYSSEVAYNEFYPKGAEPPEPNITAYLNPDNLKWKKLLSSNVEIPTDITKEEYKSPGTVGLYEGAGYSAKGLYRPEADCIMFSNSDMIFCKVCEQAIIKMIKFYSE